MNQAAILSISFKEKMEITQAEIQPILRFLRSLRCIPPPTCTLCHMHSDVGADSISMPFGFSHSQVRSVFACLWSVRVFFCVHSILLTLLAVIGQVWWWMWHSRQVSNRDKWSRACQTCGYNTGSETSLFGVSSSVIAFVCNVRFI